MTSANAHNNVGTLNEKPLHKALKEWYRKPADQVEVQLDGYIVDIKRGDLIIEIQSGNVSKVRNKISKLVQQYPFRLLLPISMEKWIVRMDEAGSEVLSRRKSPKKGSILDLFSEMVSIPKLILDENFSLEILLIREEEIRQYEQGRAWRRKGWVTQERRLINVLDHRSFSTIDDLADLLPDQVPDPFTTSDLVEYLLIKQRLAQQMSYCLRMAGAIGLVGKRGRHKLYSRRILTPE